MNIEIQSNQMNVSSMESSGQNVSSTVANKKNQQQVVKTADTQQVSTQHVSQTNAKSTQIPKDNLEKAVKKIQETADQYNRQIRFSIDESSGRTVVKVMDSNDKVVRQIPSEEVLSLAESLKAHKGLFFEKLV